MQHLLLQRNVDLPVRVAVCQLLVVEGKQEGIHEEHSTRPLRFEVRRDGRAVCDGGLDFNFVEHLVEIRRAAGLLQPRLFLHQPARVFLA